MAEELKVLTPEETDQQIISTEIAKFDVKLSDIDELTKKYSELKITDVRHHWEIKAVHDARMDVKNRRIQTEKLTKAIDARIKGIRAGIKSHSDVLVSQLTELENKLGSLEDWVVEEKARIKEEEQRKQRERIETRTSLALEAGMSFTGSAFVYNTFFMTNEKLESWSDDEFKDFMVNVMKTREQDLLRQAEEERLRKEEEARQAELKRQEEARLEEERIRLKKLADEQAERDRLFKEQQEKFEREKREFEEAKAKSAEEERQKNTYGWYYHGESDSYVCMSEYERYREPMDMDRAHCDPVCDAKPGDHLLKDTPQWVIDHRAAEIEKWKAKNPVAAKAVEKAAPAPEKITTPEPVTVSKPVTAAPMHVESVKIVEVSHVAANAPAAKMPNPTEKDLQSPVFNSIWEVIKTWDVNVPEFYQGYTGASGSHVMLILNQIRKDFAAQGLTITKKK